MRYELVGTKPPDRHAILRVEPDGRVLAAQNIDIETFGSSLPVQEVVLELKLHTNTTNGGAGSCSQLFPSRVIADVEFFGARALWIKNACVELTIYEVATHPLKVQYFAVHPSIDPKPFSDTIHCIYTVQTTSLRYCKRSSSPRPVQYSKPSHPQSALSLSLSPTSTCISCCTVQYITCCSLYSI